MSNLSPSDGALFRTLNAAKDAPLSELFPPSSHGHAGKSNPSPSDAALFRTLIAAKDAPFSAPFPPSSLGYDFYPKFGQSLALIS